MPICQPIDVVNVIFSPIFCLIEKGIYYLNGGKKLFYLFIYCLNNTRNDERQLDAANTSLQINCKIVFTLNKYK